MAYAVNNRVSKEKQKAALDFAFYLSDPGGSFWDVAHPESFLDPLRLRHTSSLSNNRTLEAKAFLEFGWENRQLSEYPRLSVAIEIGMTSLSQSINNSSIVYDSSSNRHAQRNNRIQLFE
jgi:hypothetical protein